MLTEEHSAPKRAASSKLVNNSIPRRTNRMGLFAAQALLPAVLINQIVGNQLWRIGPVYVGQIIFWGAAIVAGALVFGTFKGRWWWPFLLIAPIAARALRAMVGGRVSDLVYYFAINAVFFMAATVIAYGYAKLVRRQINRFFFLSVPLMVLQVAGAGVWTQALNTEYFVEETAHKVKAVYPTLFVPFDDVQYSVGQGRPAGFMHSNNVLSLVILLGVVLNAARTRGSLTAGDLFVSAAMILAMAKIVFLGFFVIILWILLLERGVVRRYAVRLVALVVVWGVVYRFFFPGLFELQLSAYKVFYSVFVRLYDLIRVLPIREEFKAVLERWLAWGEKLELAPYAYASEHDMGTLSGYAVAIGNWPYFTVAFVLALPILWKSIRLLRTQPRERRLAAIFGTIVAVLYPAAVPFFRAQLYWYLAGFAFLPVVMVLVRRRHKSVLIPRVGVPRPTVRHPEPAR